MRKDNTSWKLMLSITESVFVSQERAPEIVNCTSLQERSLTKVQVVYALLIAIPQLTINYRAL